MLTFWHAAGAPWEAEEENIEIERETQRNRMIPQARDIYRENTKQTRDIIMRQRQSKHTELK